MRKQAQAALEDANSSLEDKVAERTKELSQLNKDLESSNIELQQYASIASHDLQEPLRKIITFSNVIEERFLVQDPEAGKYMGKVVDATKRMRSLINDLLHYSKLSSTTHFTPTDLNEILAEALTDLELSISEKKAKVCVETLPLADVVPGQIRQVFQNIVGNALKFSQPGLAPEIKIWSERTTTKAFVSAADANGDYLRIYIQDNGIGFNEFFLGKIFTLFQRLHGRAEYEGTGIGLAIVRKIIEKHNGLITAKSKEGEGATFIIVLPLKQETLLSQTALQA
jgi:light-regulated signal transduction histidine kinase (bacteriophytochrome)